MEKRSKAENKDAEYFELMLSRELKGSMQVLSKYIPNLSLYFALILSVGHNIQETVEDCNIKKVKVLMYQDITPRGGSIFQP